MATKLVDLLVSGDLYITQTDLNVTDPDGTNGVDIIAEFDAASWTSTGFIGNFNYSHVLENENTIYSGNCGVWTYAATADRKYTLTAEMIKSADDLDFLSNMLDAYSESEAGANVPTQAYTQSSGAWTYNTAFVLPYKNAAGTKVVINSLTGGTDGPLVEDTDFFVGLNDKGETTITIIDSATVTTETQDLVFSIDYSSSCWDYVLWK